jgi:preprotein translocase subunit SecE
MANDDDDKAKAEREAALRAALEGGSGSPLDELARAEEDALAQVQMRENREAEGLGLRGGLGGESTAVARAGEGSELPATTTEGGDDDGADVIPTYMRFVYAGYIAFGMLVAFVANRAADMAWYRLGQWKPELGEPSDELLLPFSAVVGGAVAVYYFRQAKARELAESVAQELSKVTWPTRKEVTSNTFIVIVTTAIATVFFTLMDRFWGFVTNLVYGA